MKILITTVTRMANRGVDALVASKAAGLRRTFPGAEVDVMTTDWRENAPFLEKRNLGWIDDPFEFNRYRAYWTPGGPRDRMLKLTGRPRPLSRALATLAGYDLAVVTGGDNMSSDYGTPAPYLASVRRLIDLGVPVAMLGQSIGPFRDAGHRTDFLAVARDIDLITLRETASLAYVLDDLKLPRERVHLTADTAFLLEPAPAELAEKMMASFGVDPSRPVIALSASGGIAGFAAASKESHLDALERLTRRLLAETGAQILLIPHVEDTRVNNNDLIVCDALLRRLDFHPDIRMARGFMTSDEFKAIVARCQMVVAERMHVAIGGLSSGVPTFVIGYSVKGHGIMTDAFGVDSRAEGLVTPLGDFMDRPEEDDKILAVWSRRAELARVLAERLPAIKALAAKNFELLPALVKPSRNG